MPKAAPAHTIAGMYSGSHRFFKDGFAIFDLCLTEECVSATDPPRTLRVGDTLTVKGHVPDLLNGVRYECAGDWKDDPRFGLQFDAQRGNVQMHTPTLAGVDGQKDGFSLLAYAETGIAKGVSAPLIKRLIDHVGGEDAALALLEAADWHPIADLKIKLITPQRAEDLHAAWKEHRNSGDTRARVFLVGTPPAGAGLTAQRANNVLREWGSSAEQRIRENPYSLTSIRGFGFQLADEVALNLGLQVDDPKRVRAGLLHTLDDIASSEGHTSVTEEALVRKAYRMLSKHDGFNNQGVLVQDDVSEGVAGLVKIGRVVQHPNGTLAMRSLADAERRIAGKLDALLAGGPWTRHHQAPLIRDPRGEPIQFDTSQQAALEQFSRHRVMILTGGPGTGKTTITRGAIELLQAAGYTNIAACTPTGKAASRLSEATEMEGKTVHRTLEFHPDEGFRRNADNPLDIDALVLDETSMMDTTLMASLLDAVPDRAVVLFVGDHHQLPSVGPGQVLRDLIDSGRIPFAELSTNHRSASKITAAAAAMNRGETPDLTVRPGSDFFFLPAPDAAIPEHIRHLIVNRMPAYAKAYGFSPDNLQVLTPRKDGPMGTIALNVLLQEALNPPAPEKGEMRIGDTVFRLGDPVMHIENNYKLEVFNGESGRLEDVNLADRTLGVRFRDGRYVTYEGKAIFQLVPAYAITIHKSQGSEFGCVLMPVSGSHSWQLNRELVYTGATRAKSLCILIGQEDAMTAAVRKEGARRTTGLPLFLSEVPEHRVTATQDMDQDLAEGDLLGVLDDEPNHPLPLSAARDDDFQRRCTDPGPSDDDSFPEPGFDAEDFEL